MDKQIKISCEGKTTLPLDSLEPFQEKIKTISKEDYEKFRKLLIDHGLTLVKHIWKSGKHNYLIDGHQTKFTLTKMRDEEGFKIPRIPVAIVQAKSMKEAKLKVLAAASVFGTFDEKALEKYMRVNKIDIDYALSTFEFKQIDLKVLAAEMEKVKDLPPGKGGPDMKVSSDGVHQVQLYFDTKAHNKFMEQCELLAEAYGTENISDTVAKAIDEDYERKTAEPKNLG